jgi:hypothetical protein
LIFLNHKLCFVVRQDAEQSTTKEFVYGRDNLYAFAAVFLHL